ncbi:Chemotaxis protein (fragment) [metagenome]
MFPNSAIENDQILIPMAGLEIGINEIRLQTFVGSCVAICLYDKSKKICGMHM